MSWLRRLVGSNADSGRVAANGPHESKNVAHEDQLQAEIQALTRELKEEPVTRERRTEIEARIKSKVQLWNTLYGKTHSTTESSRSVVSRER